MVFKKENRRWNEQNPALTTLVMKYAKKRSYEFHSKKHHWVHDFVSRMKKDLSRTIAHLAD